MQISHEEFLMQKDGVWVDRWVGAPLMDSVEQLEAALDQPGNLWFLTDEFRFRARYTPGFAQAIWDRMEPVFRYHNALVFTEQPEDKAAYHRDTQAGFEGGIDLVGYGLDPESLRAGDTLRTRASTPPTRLTPKQSPESLMQDFSATNASSQWRSIQCSIVPSREN